MRKTNSVAFRTRKLAYRLADEFQALGGRAKMSNTKAWQAFWASGVKAVGIDVEGTHLRPPLLVQIAPLGSKQVLLEAPKSGTISKHLTRLLQDPTIVKVAAPSQCRQLGRKTRDDKGKGVAG